jgi:hypothetical protein
MTLGEIVRFAVQAYRSEFVPLFLIALVTVPLQMLSAVVIDRIESDDTETLVTLPLQIASTLVFLIAVGALIFATNRIVDGHPVEAGAALDEAFIRLGRIITTQFLYAVLTVASIVAFPYTGYRYWQDIQHNEPRGAWTVIGLLIGAFAYFSVRWTFSVQEVMLAERQNWTALDASASNVVGQWWRTLAVVLVVSLSVIPASIFTANPGELPVLVAATVGSLLLALVLPFVVIAQTLLYFDLKARKQIDVSPV